MKKITKIDYYNLPLDDPNVYEIWQKGYVKGIFQSDSKLGEHFSKLLKPTCIEHISALGAVVRPGCLEVKISYDKTCEKDGKTITKTITKSVTESYCDRKNGLEPIRYDIPLCQDILEPTYGHMIYQEQLLAIASRLAKLTLEEADKFRKAVGKKKVEVMKQAETMFIEGCKKAELVTEEQAHEVFEMMRKSQRYLFNKSHSYSYAVIGYYTAYAKTYYPLEFFCANLEYAKEKIEPKKEIKELVSDMKNFNIMIRIPNLVDLMANKEVCFTIKNDQILFGLSSIKGIGDSQVKRIVSEIETLQTKLNKTTDQLKWEEILFQTNINKTALTNLISVGVFDNLKVDRKRMLYEYNIFQELSPREKTTIVKIITDTDTNTKPYNNLLYGLELMLNLPKKDGGPFNETRKQILLGLINTLKNPPYSLSDDIRWIFEQEVQLLGCNITCSKLDFRNNNQNDTKCIDFINGKSGKMILCVEITAFKNYKIKNGKDTGKDMAFLTVEDDTGSIDCCIFAEKFDEYKHILYEGNTIVICGFKSKKNSLIIESVNDL